MCQPESNERVVKPKSPQNSLMEKVHNSEPEQTIPSETNPPYTPPAPPTRAMDRHQLNAKHVGSEQRKNGSPFIQHLLEGVLTSATSSIDRPADAREPSETPMITPPTPSSETGSSASDSDDDTSVLMPVCEESDTEHRKDALLRTKHEKDENAIYISRPEFVATEQHTLVKVGTISAVLDNAVVVTTFILADLHSRLPNSDIATATALDTGSLLCFPNGTLLGAVFETFGPVSSPLYLVRFNTSDEIPSTARVGQEIMYVEQEMCVVRARDVCRKGYDASGKDDEEVDAEDFSDDEKERRAKKLKRSGVTDRTPNPMKRKRGPRERQRQRRLERPSSRPRTEYHGSAHLGADEHQRHWTNRNPHDSNQHNTRRSEFDGVESLRAHASIPATVALPQPIGEGSPFVPPPYPAAAPASVPSMTNPHEMHGSSFNSYVPHSGYPASLPPSPFSAPVAPFSNQMMMAVSHQPASYTHFLGPHPGYNQYGPNRDMNPTQPYQRPYQQPAPLYATGPSHPYHNYEPQSSETLNRERTRALQGDPNSNPSFDVAGWQRAPQQYNHMQRRPSRM